jgi:hypothetical protein
LPSTKGVDRLELAMGDGHLDQRVEAGRLLKKSTQVAQQRRDQRPAARGRADDRLGAHVFNEDRLLVAQCGRCVVQDGAHLEHHINADRPALQGIVAMPQRSAVAQHLPGPRVGSARFFDGRPEQRVLGGHDVLDFRAQPGFLQGNRVDQDRLIRDEIPRALQLGQRPAGGDATAQDTRGFDARRWRQQGQIVVGFIAPIDHPLVPSI